MEEIPLPIEVSVEKGKSTFAAKGILTEGNINRLATQDILGMDSVVMNYKFNVNSNIDRKGKEPMISSTTCGPLNSPGPILSKGKRPNHGWKRIAREAHIIAKEVIVETRGALRERKENQISDGIEVREGLKQKQIKLVELGGLERDHGEVVAFNCLAEVDLQPRQSQ